MNTQAPSYRMAPGLWLALALGLILAGVFVLASGYLLVSLILLGLGLYGLSRWQRSRYWRIDPGPVTLTLAPDPGALQGDVAGCVQVDNPELARGQLYFQLRCVQVRERYKEYVVEHRKSLRWQARQPAFCQEDEERVMLYFQFSPPEGLAGSEAKPGLEEQRWQHYHYWELVLSGSLDGRPLVVQRFRPTVKPGQDRAAVALPEAWRTDLAIAEDPGDALPEALKQRLALTETDEGIEMQDAARPPRLLALLVAAVGVLLWSLGGGWLGAPLLVLAAWFMGRLGRVWLRPGHATLIRQWFGRPLYSRNGPLTMASQLVLEPVLVPSLFSPGEPRHRLCLTGEGKQLVLARDLRSQEEATQLRGYLVRQLGLSE